MPSAIILDSEIAIDSAIAYAEALGFDLSYLPDTVADNLLYEESTVLVTDGDSRNNNVTFTTMTYTDFHTHWQFPPIDLRTIERVY